MATRQFSQIVDDAIQQLAATSNISSLGRGAKARSILEIMGGEIASAYRSVNNDRKDTSPSSAKDQSLDLIVDLFNIERLRRTKASASLSDLNTRFFVDSSIGTFAGLSAVPSITAGSKIYTQNLSSPIIYLVTSTIGTINPAASNYYVAVQAAQAGSRYNVGRDSLTVHSFSIDGLQCTNKFPVANGRDDESNDQLRYRLFNAVRSLEAANDKALFIAARIVPGVGDIKIMPRLFGIGTAAILVRPVMGSITPPSMIHAVRSSVSSILPSSTRVIVTQPDIIGFEFEIVVNYKKAMTATEKSMIASKIISRVSRYFSRFTFGDSVSFGDIAALANQADDRIKTIGRERGVLGRAWIYTSETAGKYDSRHREELMLTPNTYNYSTQGHAFPILEESIPFPVKIVHGTEG